MLRSMDRSMIHDLKRKGWANTQIAAFVGHHRDTITRVLREPVDRQPAPRPPRPLAAVLEAQVRGWLGDGLSVQRMVELARAHGEHPFQGSDVAFYHFVRPAQRARRALPGELVQVD